MERTLIPQQTPEIEKYLNHVITEDDDNKLAQDAWGEDQFGTDPVEHYKDPSSIGKTIVEVAICKEDIEVMIAVIFEVYVELKTN